MEEEREGCRRKRVWEKAVVCPSVQIAPVVSQNCLLAPTDSHSQPASRQHAHEHHTHTHAHTHVVQPLQQQSPGAQCHVTSDRSPLRPHYTQTGRQTDTDRHKQTCIPLEVRMEHQDGSRNSRQVGNTEARRGETRLDEEKKISGRGEREKSVVGLSGRHQS